MTNFIHEILDAISESSKLMVFLFFSFSWNLNVFGFRCTHRIVWSEIIFCSFFFYQKSGNPRTFVELCYFCVGVLFIPGRDRKKATFNIYEILSLYSLYCQQNIGKPFSFDCIYTTLECWDIFFSSHLRSLYLDIGLTSQN